jgi:peroxin-7
MARAQARGICGALEPGYERHILLQLLGRHHQNSNPSPHSYLYPCSCLQRCYLNLLLTSTQQWSPTRDSSLITLPTHSCTYSAAFSPHDSSILSAVSSDSQLRLFDLRTPSSASNHLTLSIPLHSSQPSSIQQYPPSEALTQDWNKYRPTIIAAAGVDRVIRTFDIRAPAQGPLVILQGHDYPIRKIAWSPHEGHMLLSASYDMTCRVWTDGSEVDTPTISGVAMQVGAMDSHTEFAMGVDWCMFGQPGWCASCGWDERVLVWDINSSMTNIE